jgi:hypothetical protein
MLIAIPFVGAVVAKDGIAPGSCVEMAMVVGLGRKLRLATVVRSQRAQSEADSEAGEAKGGGRQPDG